MSGSWPRAFLLPLPFLAAAAGACVDGHGPASDAIAGDAVAGGAPADEAYAAARQRMVSEQVEARGVRDARVLEAMRRVPRHAFVPAELRAEAYADHPLPIGHGQTISQPYIVAFMTEALGLRGGEKVLEIGTGSGYQAAVLAEIAGEVFTIEIVEPLARAAEQRLREHGYHNVRVRAGDGYQGWPEAAPFDAVIVTAAPERVPQPLLDQLRPGGRLVIPVGGAWQELILLEKTAQGLRERRLLPVRFVPMTGQAERQ
ncbi:MAG: protein-L-isoaspartate(D-aspartate) O-methyltransferase [Planctomycetota bacterium]|nr:MAG: protein-L-isoaspartate(D-aspartate) O-methyltransferase [Planctomycetota bacterium]